MAHSKTAGAFIGRFGAGLLVLGALAICACSGDCESAEVAEGTAAERNAANDRVGGARGCTTAGCSSYNRLTFEPPITAAGSYRFEMVADGVTHLCDVTLPTFEHNRPSCSSDEVRVAADLFELTTLFLPVVETSVQVRLFKDDEVLSDDTVSAEYVVVYPNGPECPPECQIAETVWPAPPGSLSEDPPPDFCDRALWTGVYDVTYVQRPDTDESCFVGGPDTIELAQGVFVDPSCEDGYRGEDDSCALFLNQTCAVPEADAIWLVDLRQDSLDGALLLGSVDMRPPDQTCRTAYDITLQRREP